MSPGRGWMTGRMRIMRSDRMGMRTRRVSSIRSNRARWYRVINGKSCKLCLVLISSCQRTDLPFQYSINICHALYSLHCCKLASWESGIRGPSWSMTTPTTIDNQENLCATPLELGIPPGILSNLSYRSSHPPTSIHHNHAASEYPSNPTYVYQARS